MNTPHPQGQTQQQFMARVHAALGRSTTQPPTEPAPQVDESIARLASADQDVVSLFAQRAASVGMNVHRVTQNQAQAKVLALLAEQSAKRIICNAGQAGEAIGLPNSLPAEIQRVEVRDTGVDAGFECDTGISDVHAALAETGTLVCCSGIKHPRSTSLIPTNHIALVRSGDVLPDMIDYWARIKGIPGGDLPSSQVFITGPSKTADIEGILVTGVHGPARVDIVLIDDL